MRIGIDVGGTNTDAVLLDGERILAAVKRPTTRDTASGVVAVLAEVLQIAGCEPAEVQAVMVGTTKFTNAFVEARRLAPTGVIRLGRPATTSIPPLTGWPERLRGALGGAVVLCHGGCEYDGGPITPLDEAEIDRAARTFGALGVASVAISSVFAPVNAECERRAGVIVEQALPSAFVSLSHELGRLGLLERENATVINAALRPLAAAFMDGLQRAVRDSGVRAPVLISQNDGTLMTLATARRRPVATFASGPTNSIRGAAWLSGLTDCVVVDVGGTTTDVGVLVRGFPRERVGVGYLAGVRTNVRMPDIRSLGVGGGSRVRNLPWRGPRPRTAPGGSLPVIRIDQTTGGVLPRWRTVRAEPPTTPGRGDTVTPQDTAVPHPAAPPAVPRPLAADVEGRPTATAPLDAPATLPMARQTPEASACPLAAGPSDLPRPRVEVGPDSVGGDLTRAALVFGGLTVTATDVAVAGGRTSLGNRGHVLGMDRRAVRHTLTGIARRIARVADDMRASAEPQPLVVVGGAGFLVPASVPGFTAVHRPAYHSVANAVGAAIALIGVDVDRVLRMTPDTREQALKGIKEEAIARAVAGGARADSVQVVEVEEIPLAYVTGGAVRVRVKAVGDLDLHRIGTASAAECPTEA